MSRIFQKPQICAYKTKVISKNKKSEEDLMHEKRPLSEIKSSVVSHAGKVKTAAESNIENDGFAVTNSNLGTCPV